MSLVNEFRRQAELNNRHVTVQDAIDYLQSTTSWKSNSCRAYMRNFNDTELVPYRLEGFSTKDAWDDVLKKESFAGIVFSPSFCPLNDAQKIDIKQKGIYRKGLYANIRGI